MSAAAAVLCGPAHATLTLSTQPTHNVTCSAGVCSTISKRAILNVNDLASLLATSDITVQSGRRTRDIVIAAPLSWTGAHGLTFNSDRSLIVEKPIVVMGAGGLTIDTNTETGGTYSFGEKGNVTFLDMSSALQINGMNFKLAGDLATLASDVAGDPISNYALANDYNAGPDGQYSSSPVSTPLNARFEGLGHTVSNLKIKSTAAGANVGMFSQVSGLLHLHFVKANVDSTGEGSNVGVAGGNCSGLIIDVTVSRIAVAAAADSLVGGICGIIGPGGLANVHASGTVTGRGNHGTHGKAGGLAGELAGAGVGASDSAVNVTGAKHWTVGGLVGATVGSYSILKDYATGTVIVGDDGTAGGLVGFNDVQQVGESYATGTVIGGAGASVGGLIGIDTGPVSDVYSTGAVASGSAAAVGGLIGAAQGDQAVLMNTYWDTDTSGQSHGVGSDTGYPGVTGLTTAQLQSGLPTGFSDLIWAQDPGINNGFPYLLVDPPQ